MDHDRTPNDAYALIIGVGDYRAYDASTGLPPGTSDLAGSTNDAKALFRMCRLLRIPAGNIRVLASPRLRPEELGEGGREASLGEATHDEVIEGARWLAGKLDGPSRPTGVMTWSGHGDVDEARGLVLCPTDTTGDGLAGAVPYGELGDVFASPACQTNLTVLLDCCNAGSAEGSVPTSRRTSLGRRALPARLAGVAPAISERNLCASAAGAPAYQAHFDGEARGAFSWAVSVAAEQWKLTEEGSHVYLTISHEELIARAGAMLAALSFPQVPVLVAPERVGRMPVLKPGIVPRAGDASEDPTRGRSEIQLTGDVKVGDQDSDYVIYTLTLDGNLVLGRILVTNTASPDGPYEAHTEYWSLTEAVRAVPRASGMTIVGAGGFWSGLQGFPVDDALPGFSVRQEVPWHDPWFLRFTLGTLFAQQVEETERRVSLAWTLYYAGGWGGWVRWFQTAPSTEEPVPTVLGEGTFEFTIVPSLETPRGHVTRGTRRQMPNGRAGSRS